MPGLLKITPALGFHIYHRDNLRIGLHQFRISQQTSAAWKVVKAPANQHQVIAGGGAAPSLADAATLTAPDGVSLSATLAMAWGSYLRLRVVLVTLFGPDHPTTLAIEKFDHGNHGEGDRAGRVQPQ